MAPKFVEARIPSRECSRLKSSRRPCRPDLYIQGRSGQGGDGFWNACFDGGICRLYKNRQEIYLYIFFLHIHMWWVLQDHRGRCQLGELHIVSFEWGIVYGCGMFGIQNPRFSIGFISSLGICKVQYAACQPLRAAAAAAVHNIQHVMTPD